LLSHSKLEVVDFGMMQLPNSSERKPGNGVPSHDISIYQRTPTSISQKCRYDRRARELDFLELFAQSVAKYFRPDRENDTVA